MAKLTRKLRYPFETPPSEGEVIEVVDGILWARLPLPMALDHVNVYILDGDDGWTIVDTGFNSRRTRDLAKVAGGAIGGQTRRAGFGDASSSRPCGACGLVRDRAWGRVADVSDSLVDGADVDFG